MVKRLFWIRFSTPPSLNHPSGRETGVLEQASGNSPKCPFRAFSDLGEVGLREIKSTETKLGRGWGMGIVATYSLTDQKVKANLYIS